ncbi:MAG TPA: hypothetical protein GXZ77_01845 [Papillibacter sp.]|nr:hypothetical protein [Papillibacter sp.]
MSINLTTKYSTLIDERFSRESITDAYAGKKFDFDGAQSIKIYTVDRVKLSDYSRTAESGRFGKISELGDCVQTLTMTQDKSFTFAIDHGNAADQLNVKHCNEQLKSHWDEVCTPAIDIYRLSKWANGAGLGVLDPTPLTSETIMRAILTASAAMSNRLVPKKNRVLLISESLYIETKMSREIMAVDTLGAEAIKNGCVGRIDGMDVVPVIDSYLPAGINFMIKYKDATADPMKLKVLRVQKNPLGFDADIGECRFYHDSFVLDAKVDGIFVHAVSGMCPVPTFTGTQSVTITCEGAGVIRYTTDGSNPKTSPTAAVYTGPVALEAGQTLRAYGAKEGLVNSPIAAFTRKA